MKTVAVFEAKSRLSQILAAVEHGEDFTVTKRGEPIARIIPYRRQAHDAAMCTARRKLIGQCREARDALPRLDFDVRAAIEEGRD
ncbi:MAG: type II toxin-antitoxin system prevent-host-death family antitoxin [Gammaproteobacteria bacterium]|nr:type II toxin-antitoxin system prevent-host-death family antitoxin [Rhodocyclaceae bacterium]MBU3909556.1 type II toxin-antitoxin system prevent-host-death family antitoxin [Gammaproteobacteria bacterium]MBU3990839.1 type II toxin-antitoxin system prevent-host-death family antitoxin [Gammaproteobacteria bacterium]MBU4003219.1 type II toxin-antitoxin system prevent-host-death family antitoxin [Gammaproteobacteria bacterium]MBU4022268.1 type II toxin-antitoxin system prevent-host-death family 